jgi:hypothetical protein
MNKTLPHSLLAAALALVPAASALACASCGCGIDADWSAQGLSSTPGLALDIRMDGLNQDRLWSGTHAIAATQAALLTNTRTGDPAEVEQYTRNRYLTATADYNDGKSLGLSIALPFIDRRHSTLGTGSDGIGFDPAHGAYTSSGAGLGDVRVVGRYFGFNEQHDFGLQFGLKLPSGSKGQLGDDGRTVVDPGLQRGTGTTDLILGAYGFGSFSGSADWGYFGQATFQTALDHSSMAGGSYRPGDSLNLSLGAHYAGLEGFVPNAQINARIVRRDSGTAADTFATGGTLLYLTLGGMAPVSGGLSAYANLHVPLYQRVNGVQLTPRYFVSVGARYSF